MEYTRNTLGILSSTRLHYYFCIDILRRKLILIKFFYVVLGPGASSNPCNDAYRGTHAFSEVEVRNVANYLRRLGKQIAGYMDIHAYSQLWMTPWGYTKSPSRDHEELVLIRLV